jgi:predicted O-linked N-acetylglucosamine transferase (SPINDLY family)
LACYDKALAIKPDSFAALNNRGIILSLLDRDQEALASYDQALTINPNFAHALSNRGEVLRKLHRQEEALASFDQALAINPYFVGALNNRGNALLKLRHPEAALASYEKALALKSDPTVHTSLIFALNFDPAASAARQQAERTRWNELYAQQFVPLIRPHKNDPNPHRRLRIGYVSSHFRSQASTYAFGGVLLRHNPASFEVFCYSDTLREDDLTGRLRAGSQKWRQTRGLSNDEFADLVRADGIDILVDCVGHMEGHRLLAFARKPAPIQVTAWGEPTGTGLTTMDYLLADPVLVPASERDLLAEQVFDLPNFLSYWTPEPLPEPAALPAIANGYVTFGSFNRLEKLQDPVLRCWAGILRLLPNARLVLKGDQSLAESSQGARIVSIFSDEGIVPERVTLIGPSDRANHFAAYQRVDIALDPFPHGGGMTTLDALWMGVPVVTWSGRTISSRLAAASLATLALTDFIASDSTSYVSLAVAKAANIDALAGLRAGLRGHVASSAIGDPTRYTQAVEAAYRTMWQRWCANMSGGAGAA